MTPSIEEINTMTASELLAYIKQWGDERRLTDPAHSSSKVQGLKLVSELGELADNLAKGKDVKDDIGDCMVVLVMIAALEGHSINECLAVAYADIKDRKGIMYEGVFIKESDPRYAELTGTIPAVAGVNINTPLFPVGYDAPQVSNGDPTKFSSGSVLLKQPFLSATPVYPVMSAAHFGELLKEACPGGNEARRAQVLGAELALALATRSKEVYKTGQAITDGYYTMYNKLLSVPGTDEEVIASCFYLLTEYYGEVFETKAKEIIHAGLK